MMIEIDFGSDEAIYVQLRNQIVIGIASAKIQEGDALPSVRQLANHIGINMHTVNKAYTVLRQEGFITLDRRKGAVIALEIDKAKALEGLKENFQILMAESRCRNISREEVHQLIDEIYLDYESGNER